MQIVINIDPRFPRWLKRALLFGGFPAFLLGATLVSAGVTVTKFNTRDQLSSTAMNDNFQALVDGINNLVPPGTVVAYAAPVDGNPGVPRADGGPAPSHLPPTGWLFCNGDAVSRTQYPALFGVLGIAHGMGDGINTFNLPDLRGRFLRGVDNGVGRDPDSAARTAAAPSGNTGDAVGSIEIAATALANSGLGMTSAGSHNHGSATGTEQLVGGGIYYDYSSTQYLTASPSGNMFVKLTVQGRTHTHAIGTDGAHTHTIAGGDRETRPMNLSLNFIVKL